MQELALSYPEVILRLLLTIVLCGIVGLEREIRDQPAGFRTHILLGLGATLFTLVSAYGFQPFTTEAAASVGIRYDPTRIAAQIIAGIGFLGAGAILRESRGGVRGLTTAASLWTAAAIGMAVGAGYFFGAVAATAVVMLTLYALRGIRSRVVSRFGVSFSTLELSFFEHRDAPRQALRVMRARNLELRNLSAQLRDGELTYTLEVRIPLREDVPLLMEELGDVEGVKSASLYGMHE